MDKWDLKKIKSSDKFPVEYKYKKGENIINGKHEFVENTCRGFIFSSRKEDREFNFIDKLYNL